VATGLMQNVVVNMCEKLHNDRLKNDRALGNRNSGNNLKNQHNNINNVGSAWRPVSGSKNHSQFHPEQYPEVNYEFNYNAFYHDMDKLGPAEVVWPSTRKRQCASKR